MGEPAWPEGREFKLLLEPAEFAGEPKLKMAETFLAGTLADIVEKSLGSRDLIKAAFDEEKTEERNVCFYDTGDLRLYECDYVLRQRVEKKARSFTLKYRSPDLFLAAEAFRNAADNDDIKFEEDISPLQVRRETAGGSTEVIIAAPKGLLSRFAVSIDADGDAEPKTLGDAFALFGNLADSLRALGYAADDDTELVSGPLVREVNFEGAKVDLGDDSVAKFALSFWYFVDEPKGKKTNGSPGRQVPAVAEISFKQKVEKGRLAPGAARRATALFLAMQGGLPVDHRATSKTALALPRRSKS